MQRLVVVLTACLLGGAAAGSFLAYKAFGWRKSLLALKASQEDIAGISVYAVENAAILASARRPDVVLLGASHTLDWGDLKERFPGLDVLNRGVGGQLVPQYVLRFRQDVIDLRPKVVVIEGCAINATYDVPMRTLMDSYATMADLARGHGIDPILATTLPVGKPWEDRLPGTNKRVREINDGIRELARRTGCRLVDYYAAVAGADGLLPASDTNDGMHCRPRVYGRMQEALRPLLEGALGHASSPATRRGA